MTTKARHTGTAWNRFVRLRRQRRVQTMVTLGLVLLGPMLALATFLVLGPLEGGSSSLALRLVLMADLVYVLLLVALVAQRVLALVAARRAHSEGSRLHLRLTGVFALMALLPTVTVAVFAMLTINIGLETWFSERVRQVVGASLAAAQAYDEEERRDLNDDALLLARFITDRQQLTGFTSDGDIRVVLTEGQSLIQRGLKEAYVINGDGDLQARGQRSYLFDFEEPSRQDMGVASRPEIRTVPSGWSSGPGRGRGSGRGAARYRSRGTDRRAFATPDGGAVVRQGQDRRAEGADPGAGG